MNACVLYLLILLSCKKIVLACLSFFFFDRVKKLGYIIRFDKIHNIANRKTIQDKITKPLEANLNDNISTCINRHIKPHKPIRLASNVQIFLYQIYIQICSLNICTIQENN